MARKGSGREPVGRLHPEERRRQLSREAGVLGIGQGAGVRGLSFLLRPEGGDRSMSEPGPRPGRAKPAAEAFAQSPGDGRAGPGEGGAGLNLRQVFPREVVIFLYSLLRFPNLVSSSWARRGLFFGHRWL